MNPHILFVIGVTFIAFPLWLCFSIAFKDKPPVSTVSGVFVQAAMMTALTLLVAFGIRILCLL